MIVLLLSKPSSLPSRELLLMIDKVLDVVHVRNDIAKPTIGEDADKYVPFLWTLFLFILFNNLLGMFPFLGSPTASIWVTFAMSVIVFFARDRMDPALVETAPRARADLLGRLLQDRAPLRLDAGHGRQRTGRVIAFAALRTSAPPSGS